MQRPAGPILRDPNPGLSRTLLHGLYDLVWGVAALLGSPWWLWRSARDRSFRRMVVERMTWGLPRLPRQTGAAPRLLVHGVSVGEIKGAVPFVRELRARHPELEVVVSVSTNTGLEVARSSFPDLCVVRYPFDPAPLVRRFLDRIDPDGIVLIELEIWPNFLRLCNRRALPVAIVNGRITENSFERYLAFRRAVPQFNRISFYAVQLEEYEQRFLRLGAEPGRVVVTGNMKADGLRIGQADRSSRELSESAKEMGVRPEAMVFACGSTHGPEERLLTGAWRTAIPEARLILVPRHPQRAEEVARELASMGLRAQRLTDLRGGEAPDAERPLIVDTIGELDGVYALADLVFVGGSLIERGGQNVLEPAALGRGVLHGPHTDNFRQEVALLRQAGASREVADASELAALLVELAADPEARRAMGSAGLQAVASQRGATERTVELLERRWLAAWFAGASGQP